MRKALLYILLLCATGAAAQPTVTGDAKVRLNLSNSYWDATVNQILSGRVGPDSTFVKFSGSYLNRRIGDNVYKFGTLGVRTSDTTGVLNVRTRTGKTGEVITMDTSGEGTVYLSMLPPGFDNVPGLQPFQFMSRRYQGVNAPYNPSPNFVWRFGYNQNTDGSRISTSAPAMGFDFEHLYHNASLPKVTEFHIYSIDSLGNTLKFITAANNWNAARGGARLGFQTDLLTFNDKLSSPVWSHNPLTNIWTFADTTGFAFSERRGFALSVLNGAGAAFLNLMDFNGTDTLEISRQNVPNTKIGSSLTLNNGLLYAGNAASGGAISVGALTRNTPLNVFGNTTVGSTGLGARLFVFNDYSSTSAAGSDAWAVMHLRNRNNTNNNWSAIQFNASSGTIAADVAAQYVNQSSAYADLVWHTRGAATSFGEAGRVTSEKELLMGGAGAGARIVSRGKGATSSTYSGIFENSSGTDALVIRDDIRVGIGVTLPVSTLDVEGGASIGATYSGTTAAPTNGAIIEGNVGVGNSSPGARLHVTTASGATTAVQRLENTTGDVDVYVTNATPESAITANPGDIAIRTDASNGKIYIKGSGTGNTGWVDQSAGGAGGHTIRDDGSDMTNRGALNFVSTATITATATDDSGNDETEITLNVPTDGIGATQIAAGAVGSSELASSAVTAGNYYRAFVSFDEDGRATGAQNGGILDDGSAENNRLNMNFLSGLNSSAVVTDDSGNDETEIKVDVLGGSISPSQITADVDNYSPTDWSTNTTARISGDNIWAITSFAALADGTIRRIVNIGTKALYVPAEHPDGTAANRVAGSTDQFIAPNGGIMEMYYDGTSSRWRVTDNTFSPSNMLDAGVVGHYYTMSAGSTVAADWGTLGFATASGGNGQTAPTSALPGGFDINTASSASGVATLYYADGVTNPVELGSAHIVTSCTVYFPTLSDGTQTYTFQFGIVPTPTSTTLAVNNSVAIRYSSGINSGKFEGFSRNNAGTESTVDLGTTVAANTPYVLTVAYDKARAEGRFYVNGAFAGRVTGSMPNAVDAGGRAAIMKTAGTTSRSASIAQYIFYTIY